MSPDRIERRVGHAGASLAVVSPYENIFVRDAAFREEWIVQFSHHIECQFRPGFPVLDGVRARRGNDQPTDDLLTLNSPAVGALFLFGSSGLLSPPDEAVGGLSERKGSSF